MAYQNKIISNPVTKHDIRFLQTAMDTSGELLEMESTYRSQSKEPPAHYHPLQQEVFTVLSGELTVRIDGTIRILKPGETLHVPKNKIHSMWNATTSTTVVNWQVRPALNTEHFIETFAGLAADGKTNDEGRPSLLQVARLANKYAHVFRLAKPPYLVQKIFFGILSPFALLAGYRSFYRKYID